MRKHGIITTDVVKKTTELCDDRLPHSNTYYYYCTVALVLLVSTTDVWLGVWWWWWWWRWSLPLDRRMSSGLPLLSVNPRVTDETNSYGELSAAIVTDEGSCTVWGLGGRDWLTRRTFPLAALFYCVGDTDVLKFLHRSEASISPFRSVAC